jgi:hypothetical protein
MKSRRMRWMGHVEGMGGGGICTGLFWVNMKEGEHLEDLGVDGSKTLK